MRVEGRSPGGRGLPVLLRVDPKLLDEEDEQENNGTNWHWSDEENDWQGNEEDENDWQEDDDDDEYENDWDEDADDEW